MSSGKARIPPALRERVSQQAGYRCGYCLSSQELLGMPMTIEHLIPETEGGPTVEDNLWLSCVRCNLFKRTQTHAVDPETGERVPLFDPRRDVWNEHFRWDDRGVEILGTTPRGRATCIALRLNNEDIVVTRRLWVAAGWWPPRGG
jgi:hypothetical protein